MGWFMLVAGAPKVPDDWGWEQSGALPRPLEFFRALFLELASISLDTWTITDTYVEPRELQIVQGFYGNEHIGLRSSEQISLFSSMFPQQVRDKTYGLVGVEITWEYEWVKSGHGYFFQHRELRARFDNQAVREVFVHIWSAVFGTAPVFESITSEEQQ